MIISLTLTDFARHENVGQEVHFDFDYSVAGAAFASAARYIERKPAGLISAFFCILSSGKQFAYRSKRTGISCGITSRRSAYGTLIDGNNVGPATKSKVAYLPDRTYLTMNQTIREILDYFQDFYADFSRERAEEMLKSLGIDPTVKMRTLSKGTKEKV